MGIRPRGDGDRDISCHVQPLGAAAPFDTAGDNRLLSWFAGAPLDTRRGMVGFLRCRIGLRLLGRGRRPVASAEESDDSSWSMSSSILSCLVVRFRADARVVGPV